jgi:hypothetical protein
VGEERDHTTLKALTLPQFSILGESAGEAEVLSVFGSLVLLLEGYVHVSTLPTCPALLDS